MCHNKQHIFYIVMDVQTQGLPHIYICVCVCVSHWAIYGLMTKFYCVKMMFPKSIQSRFF
jgi:hypothetical protein